MTWLTNDALLRSAYSAAATWALAAVVAMPASAGPTGRYVDSRLCAACHAQIADAYRKTGMGRSFFRPSTANTIENYAGENSVYHQRSDTHYSMISRDGALYQRRWQVGFDGKETNVEEAKIDYILGSGNHARSYLHRTSRGTLIELPLGWYAEKGGYWAMSPGFDSLHPPTRRLVSYECMFCHNAYPQIPAANQAAGSEPVYTGDLPQGIDCQRCHGPGSDHVAVAQTAGAAAERIRTTIVSPARLGNRRRVDLCMQCHLEPTSTRFPSLIRRFDRAPFSFVAGEPLAGFLLAFDHAAGTGHDDKFEIVGSSAYRLRKSRCFLESGDKLTCETCHDPHPVTAANEALPRSTRACRGCHAPALDRLIATSRHTASNDCAKCHMPKRRTEDVVHVVMTDHLIQRQPLSRDLVADLAESHPAEEEEYRGEVVPYYTASDPRYRALAQVAQKNNLYAGVAGLARILEQQHPRDPEWYLQLGDAWLAGGSAEKAALAYQEAIRLAPRSAQAQQSLGQALKSAGQVQRAAEILHGAIQISPDEPRSWYQLANVDFTLGHAADALRNLEKAIALDPDLPGAYTTLAFMAAAAGEQKRAADALREALIIDPCDAAAWDLSGRLHAQQNQVSQAIFDFEQALRYRHGFASYLYDYALTLFGSGEFDRAEESAQAAAKADPTLPEPHALLGRILARRRQMSDAAKEYAEALRLRPDFAQARLDLASVLMAGGERAKAIEHLREVARGKDPSAARIAAAALQRLGEQ